MRCLLIAVLAFMLSLPVAAQDFEKGRDAAHRGDYATALREWRVLAEAGDARGQSGIGYLYLYGRGVKQDITESVKWLHLSGNQGYAPAQLSLGFMYIKGRGVKADNVRAHMWFALAVKNGESRATQLLANLAEKLTSGQIAESKRLAREWMEKHGKAE